jgi:hypothetical protein
LDLKIEEISCRLDRIYFECLSGTSAADVQLSPPGHDKDQGQQMAAFEMEIDTLYSEIASVAEMSVRQQFLEPLTDQLRFAKAESEEEMRRILDYVC